MSLAIKLFKAQMASYMDLCKHECCASASMKHIVKNLLASFTHTHSSVPLLTPNLSNLNRSIPHAVILSPAIFVPLSLFFSHCPHSYPLALSLFCHTNTPKNNTKITQIQ